MEPLHLCSDMPVEDMAEDVVFGSKKYMLGLALVLKKGLTYILSSMMWNAHERYDAWSGKLDSSFL